MFTCCCSQYMVDWVFYYLQLCALWSNKIRAFKGGLLNSTAKGISEDWLSVWIGLLVFVLALGMLAGTDILGWVVTTAVWTDPSKALNPVSKAYSALGGVGALITTYSALLVVMTAAAAVLKADLKRFALGFT